MEVAGIVIGVVVAVLFIMGIAYWMVRRRRQRYAETHVVDNSKSTDGNLLNPDGQSLHLQTAETHSRTFDSDGNGDHSSNSHNNNNNRHDGAVHDLEADAESESGHMA